MADYYKTDEDVLRVVQGFEDCTTSKEDFTHVSHLTVATYYLLASDPDAACKRMCSGLLSFIAHHGVNPAKYNEPLTRAWIDAIQKVIEEAPALPVVDVTNLVIEQLSKHRIILDSSSSARD